ncbi:hypothetical protein SAMN04488535_1894 [Corynebacterium mycetoides]|uniref:Asp23 family, cell envelope-related function n=1 Tax=Corynebacterium mycetoides TaxID=38302 RepID=A0A1G9QEP2_9CORY|nr:hypothetical protein [Corynebacterium mycetoides]SDM09479.1 hypothetical protein SAMN04488535_1894 [Corynebacterium mycetoides]
MPAGISREAGEAVRDAALSVPGVASLSDGRFGEVALLLPGTRIGGIRPATRGTGPGLAGVEVHIVYAVASGRPVAHVAGEVRAAALAATGLPFVDVVVADAQ